MILFQMLGHLKLMKWWVCALEESVECARNAPCSALLFFSRTSTSTTCPYIHSRALSGQHLVTINLSNPSQDRHHLAHSRVALATPPWHLPPPPRRRRRRLPRATRSSTSIWPSATSLPPRARARTGSCSSCTRTLFPKRRRTSERCARTHRRSSHRRASRCRSATRSSTVSSRSS